MSNLAFSVAPPQFSHADQEEEKMPMIKPFDVDMPFFPPIKSAPTSKKRTDYQPRLNARYRSVKTREMYNSQIKQYVEWENKNKNALNIDSQELIDSYFDGCLVDKSTSVRRAAKAALTWYFKEFLRIRDVVFPRIQLDPV